MKLPDDSRRRPRRRNALLATGVALLALLAAAAPASAEFGFSKFDVQFNGLDATPSIPTDDPPATQAGSHPFAVTTTFEGNFTGSGFGSWKLDGQLRDLIIDQVAGLSGDATAVPRCPALDFIEIEAVQVQCSDDTAIGIAGINVSAPAPFAYWITPVYNLEPPPGVIVRVGFVVANVTTVVDLGVKTSGKHNAVAKSTQTSQVLPVFGGVVQLWGVPADPIHDRVRGHCIPGISVSQGELDFATRTNGECPSSAPLRPFLNLPTSCRGPVATSFVARSWEGASFSGSVLSHDSAEPPNPQGFTGCGRLDFAPRIESNPGARSAETGSGLDFEVSFNDEGLTNPEGLTESQIEKAVVTLPEGVTVNASAGEGLGFCTPDDVDDETLTSEPGEGCPENSKIGTVQVDSPLVDDDVEGSVYLAQQDDPGTSREGAENPFDSLLAFYIVLRNQKLGISVTLPAEVEPDPLTGQLVTTVEDIPQLPFNRFNFHFKEGQRATLVTPPTCGTYTTEAKLYPWSDPDNPRTVTSDFEITEGVNGGPCPPEGIPPFNPHFEAGSLNNNAGSFSPFNMRLIRRDGEQDMTRFGSVLPPGVLGKLAGVGKCPELSIAIARTKTGREEQAAPSCPPNSQIGRTQAGAGVGSALTYVPGSVYLAGPHKGAPLSVVSITPAVAGPFDAGNVVVRIALTLNPKTSEVEVDGASSDPIPHILQGIPLKVRDVRVYVDRVGFILNPTNCNPSSAKATLFGGFLDVFSPADDVPVALATRYQAANCLNLGYRPHLGIRLKGGTRRGAFPGFRATYNPRPGDANIEGLVLRLPRSAFLEQGHIRTICTRVQFAAEACPKASQYGYIRAWTPLLDTPLQGPVYLRSSNNKLPDVVFDLEGIVDVEVATRIDSVNGGIRATLTNLPDAPISKVFLRMQGGKKGLIVNSRHLCKSISRANVRFSGQNGKRRRINPVVRASCGKRRAKRSSHGRAGRAELGGLRMVE